jgi:hypothetical protein
MPDRQDRAAQVPEHHDAGADVRGYEGVSYAIAISAEAAVGSSPHGLDRDLRARHLAGELGETRGDLGAVRYEYDPDHVTALLAPLNSG